ncbi:ABC transporter permease [Clostridium hydrogenum]|uniref:ABC transporter permease n=1 Tax=Clostridium hydrogenum TaxID=2855764 RepID=UPI001F3689A3|nr:FtsX-like permease family protein [Clostridium hydrogenum]
MKFSDGLRLASRDLGRRKGRTFLTSLAVAVGTMLIVTLVSLGTSGEGLILKQVQDSPALKEISVMNMKWFDTMNTSSDDIDFSDMYKKIDDNTVKKLSKINGVNDIRASISVNVSDIKIDNKENKNDTQVVGLSGNASEFSKDKIASVRKDKKDNKLEPIAFGRALKASDKDGVLVAENYLKAMGITDYKSVIGKDITITVTKTENPNITLQPYAVKGKIVGVIDDKFVDDSSVIAAIDMTGKLKSYYDLQDNYLQTHGYESVMINAKSIDDVSSISASIKKMNYANESYYEIVQYIKNAFKIIKVILAVLGIVVLFVAAVGTVNTMTMVIYERTKSIGIMKSIGANRANIHSVFLAQAGIIGLMGGVMGMIFSSINIGIISFVLKAYLKSKKVTQTVNITMPLWLILGTLAFSIVICIIAGIYPSRKASKMDPVEALNS